MAAKLSRVIAGELWTDESGGRLGSAAAEENLSQSGAASERQIAVRPSAGWLWTISVPRWRKDGRAIPDHSSSRAAAAQANSGLLIERGVH